MENKYQTPKCEEIEARLEGVIAMSNDDQEDGGEAEVPLSYGAEIDDFRSFCHSPNHI